MVLRTCAQVLVLGVALLGVTHANDLRDEARAHSELGKIAFKQERYREAATEFLKAYELAPVPDLLFNIARCQEQLHEDAAAIHSYEQYLAARPEAPDRLEIEASVRAMRERLTKPPEPQPQPQPQPPLPPAAAPAPPIASSVTLAPQAPPGHPSRRRLFIGLTIGGVALVAGAVVLGVLLGTRHSEPFVGNISPGYAGISP